MKIFITLFFPLFFLFSFSPAFSLESTSGCSWNGGSVADSLRGCEPKNALVENGGYAIEWWLKNKVVRITNQLIIAGSLLAVGAIVFAAVLYTIALGDAEKVKKAKNSLQFAVIGFAVMLLSYAIVNTIVNLVYGIR